MTPWSTTALWEALARPASACSSRVQKDELAGTETEQSGPEDEGQAVVVYSQAACRSSLITAHLSISNRKLPAGGGGCNKRQCRGVHVTGQEAL